MPGKNLKEEQFDDSLRFRGYLTRFCGNGMSLSKLEILLAIGRATKRNLFVPKNTIPPRVQLSSKHAYILMDELKERNPPLVVIQENPYPKGRILVGLTKEGREEYEKVLG